MSASTLPVSRSAARLYLPSIAITGLAGWLSWRGWLALEQSGVARSISAGRYELAGPVVLGSSPSSYRSSRSGR